MAKNKPDGWSGAGVLAWGFFIAVTALWGASDGTSALFLFVLSGRADMIGGGDPLVGVNQVRLAGSSLRLPLATANQ